MSTTTKGWRSAIVAADADDRVAAFARGRHPLGTIWARQPNMASTTR
jgi:hypothetical protein